MTETTFFDCDAPGCPDVVSIVNAENWYVVYLTGGRFGAISETDEDDLGDIELHACSRAHLAEAIVAITEGVLGDETAAP